MEIKLDAAIAQSYRETWEAHREGLVRLTRHPWAQERADRYLWLQPVEAQTPLGRIRVRLVLGPLVSEAEDLARKLNVAYAPVQVGKERGIVLTTSDYMSLISAWDGPAGF